MTWEPSFVPLCYTAGDVARLLRGRVTEVQLNKWDDADIFFPTYYASPGAGEALMTREERRKFVAKHGKSQGNPHRRFTFLDVLLLRIFLYVKEQLVARGRGPIVAVRESSRVIAELRRVAAGRVPAASKLLFLGDDIYLASDRHTHCLTRPGQLALQLSTAEVIGEVSGRLAYLDRGTDIDEEANLAVG